MEVWWCSPKISMLERSIKKMLPAGTWIMATYISSEDGSYDLPASKTGVTQIDIDKRCVIWSLMPN